MTCVNTAIEIVRKLQNSGYTTYFAGGWVRDYLMNHPSDDIDIATDADSETVQKLFPKTIPVGIQFGIVIVVENGHQFEVATFRKESEYKDARRPLQIEKASPKCDALRRDFTINGMFYDPISQTVYDFVGGQEDLKKKVIRAIGNPKERFNEDRLRLIRAIRYSARFHFPIEDQTKQAMLHFSEQLFPAVAIERVVTELEKMAKFPNFAVALKQLFDFRLLQQVFPSLTHIPKQDLQNYLRYIPNFPGNAPLIAKLLELFPSAQLEQWLQICDHLKLSNRDKRFVEYYHKISAFFSFDIEKHSAYEWAHMYAHSDYLMCQSIAAAKRTEKQQFEAMHNNYYRKLDSHILRIKQNRPLVCAQDFIDRGISPGPQLGELLKQAEMMSINEGIEDKQIILKHLLQ